jgi:hypothetical protein
MRLYVVHLQFINSLNLPILLALIMDSVIQVNVIVVLVLVALLAAK